MDRLTVSRAWSDSSVPVDPASHTVRINAAGRRFTTGPNAPRGTVVTVELPASLASP